MNHHCTPLVWQSLHKNKFLQDVGGKCWSLSFQKRDSHTYTLKLYQSRIMGGKKKLNNKSPFMASPTGTESLPQFVISCDRFDRNLNLFTCFNCDKTQVVICAYTQKHSTTLILRWSYPKVRSKGALDLKKRKKKYRCVFYNFIFGPLLSKILTPLPYYFTLISL